MHTISSSPLLVGREAQLQQVRAFAQAVAARRGGALLLRGEAGAGKTRLARELAAEARVAGTDVLTGACVAVGDDPLRHAALVEIARAAARRDPRSGAPAAALPTDAMLERLLTLVDDLPAHASLLFVIEDLHWADRGTCEVLSVLCRHVQDRAVGVAMTCRDDELPRAHHVSLFVTELLRAQLAAPVPVPALSALDVAQLVQLLLGDTDPGVAARIFELSGGNPLLVEELCAAGLDAAALASSPMRDVMLARFVRLSDPARDLVRAVAVAGTPVPEHELAAVREMDPAVFTSALREALDLHVLARDEDAVGFRHVLMADAVYADLLSVERIELHRRWARELETDVTAVPRLAHHWYEAKEYERAFDATLVAARDAGADLAYDSAHRHYRRALALWDRVAQPEARAGMSRADCGLAAAEAANWAGEPAAAVAAVDEALALPEADDPALGSVLLERRGWYLMRQGDDANARVAYERALATLPAAADPAVRTRVLAGSVRAWERAAEYERALELAREAVAVAVETDAASEIGPAHYMLGRMLSTLGDVDGALAEFDQAASRAEEVVNPVMLAITLVERGDALARHGELAAAIPAARATSERLRARGLGDPVALLADASAAALLFRLGRIQEGHALALAMLAEARAPVTLAISHLLAGAFDVEALRLATAREHLETARFLAAPLLDGRVGAALAAARADLAFVDGNIAAALSAVEEGLARVAHTGDDEAYAHLCLQGLRIESAREALVLGRASGRARRRRDAQIDALDAGVARVLAGWPPETHRPDLVAIRSAWLAERNRLDDVADPDAWQRAMRDWNAIQWPRLAATAAIGHVEALARGADGATVSAAIADARAAAAAVESAYLRAEIDDLERRLGLAPARDQPSPSRAAVGTVGALTRREREVLDLIAAGATNRQIATRLFISPKTASVHVSRILTKLGVTNRAEAAELARRAARRPRG